MCRIANLLIGTVGVLWVLRWLGQAHRLDCRRSGFRSARLSLISMALGLLLGGLVYVAQGAPSRDPLVILNAFAQVLTVSIPEALVCWAVIGAAAEVLLRPHGRIIAVGGAALFSSILFGLYHAAHTPPFNTAPMIALLTIVGYVRSANLFSLREVHGTILVHSGLALFGVAQVDMLADYGRAKLALYGMAAVIMLALIAGDLLWLRAARRPARTS